MRRRQRWTARAAATAAVLVMGGLSTATAQQKPPPLGAPAAPADPGKFATPPAPQGRGVAPQQGRAAPPPPPQAAGPGAVDKFGAPVAPPPPAAAAPPPTDKFASPPPSGPQAVPPASPPATASPRAPAAPPAPAPATIPANEPESVRTLRALLGADAALSYAAAEIIDPARGAVRLREVEIRRPDRSATAAELTLDGLREDGVTEAIARGLTFREGAPDAPGATMERLRIAGLAIRRPPAGQEPTPDMISLDSLRIEGLAVQGATPVAIASLLVEDYAAGRPGRIALEGLEVREANTGGPVDRISLGRASLRGIDLAGTFAALVAQQQPPRPGGSYAIEAEELVLGQGGRRVGGLATFSLGGEAPPPGAPGVETGRLALRDLRVEPFPGLDEWLQRFGYAALSADLTAEARLDRATGRMELRSLSLAGRDIGAVALSMVLDGVRSDATSPEELQQARLVSMALRYVDQSLYQRFVRQQARETRQTEQQVRQALAEQAAALLQAPPPGGAPGSKGGAAGGGEDAAMAAIRTAVQRFLRGEAREIEIAARPPQPLRLEELQGSAAGGPAAARDALGLTATAR